MQMYEQLDPKKKLKIEGFSFGGGPAAERLPGDVRRKLPMVSPAQGYGLTEVNSVATSFGGDDYVEREPFLFFSIVFVSSDIADRRNK